MERRIPNQDFGRLTHRDPTADAAMAHVGNMTAPDLFRTSRISQLNQILTQLKAGRKDGTLSRKKFREVRNPLVQELKMLRDQEDGLIPIFERG